MPRLVHRFSTIPLITTRCLSRSESSARYRVILFTEIRKDAILIPQAD